MPVDNLEGQTRVEARGASVLVCVSVLEIFKERKQMSLCCDLSLESLRLRSSRTELAYAGILSLSKINYCNYGNQLAQLQRPANIGSDTHRYTTVQENN